MKSSNPNSLTGCGAGLLKLRLDRGVTRENFSQAAMTLPR